MDSPTTHFFNCFIVWCTELNIDHTKVMSALCPAVVIRLQTYINYSGSYDTHSTINMPSSKANFFLWATLELVIVTLVFSSHRRKTEQTYFFTWPPIDTRADSMLRICPLFTLTAQEGFREKNQTGASLSLIIETLTTVGPFSANQIWLMCWVLLLVVWENDVNDTVCQHLPDYRRV